MAQGIYEQLVDLNKKYKQLCCKIEQCCEGGGSSTNIYNSDGTLTGNRTLNGDGLVLLFNNLQRFDIQGTNFASTLAIDDATGEFLVSANYIQIFTPDIIFEINNISNILKTQYQQNDIGLKLDFANDRYIIGNEGPNKPFLFIDGVTQNIQTIYNGNTNYGINLDYVNNIYELKSLNLNVTINDNLGTFTTLGIFCDSINNYYSFGNGFFADIATSNFQIADINNGNFLEYNVGIGYLKTQYGGNDIGLKLDFANNQYWIGDEAGINSGSVIKVNDGSSQIQLLAGTVNNVTSLILEDNPCYIYTQYQSSDKGLRLDFANSVYQFGQITGGNTKTFTIDDGAGFGFQFSGTGITQATTGATSGQYLKVNVGGTDYVIELKNPS